MDRVLTLTVFRRVAELHSFSAAARDLGLSNAAVSKHVAVLEDRVRARLLQRTTRRVSLTAAGAAYLERCARILDELADLDEGATGKEARLAGTLRVNAPLSFGLLHLAPLLPRLLARWPELEVDLTLTDQLVDLAEEGADVIVRVTRTLADSATLVGQRLASVDYAICGSPGYFRAHGVPRTPADLAEHNCIVYGSAEWTLARGDRTHRVRVSGNLRINNSLAIRDALLAGLGISLMPRFYVDELLRRRRLRSVLDDHVVPPAHVHALYARHRQTSARIRGFVDFLREELGRAPWASTRKGPPP
jgi:DNA-binding transcriptional LysR family regulator